MAECKCLRNNTVVATELRLILFGGHVISREASQKEMLTMEKFSVIANISPQEKEIQMCCNMFHAEYKHQNIRIIPKNNARTLLVCFKPE